MGWLMLVLHYKVITRKNQLLRGGKMEAEARKVVSVTEAASMLGIGRNLCYEAIRRGEIPAIRIGKRLLVPMVALERLLAMDKEDLSNDQPR